jgi:hypothetical protein
MYFNSGPVVLQIGNAVLAKVTVSVWNRQYGNSGMVIVQVGAASLVTVIEGVWNGSTVTVG